MVLFRNDFERKWVRSGTISRALFFFQIFVVFLQRDDGSDELVKNPALKAFRSERISSATGSNQKRLRTQVVLIRDDFECIGGPAGSKCRSS